MKVLNRGNWKAALLLSIIVPVGLLTAWRIMQLQNELPPENIETVTLDPVVWEFEKCFRTTDYPLWFNSSDEAHVNNTYRNGFASITHTIIPAQYIVNFGDYEGSSFFSIGVNLTASVTEGFLENIRIVFSEGYNVSQVWLGATSIPSFVTWGNLTRKDWACGFYREWLLEGDVKAFVETEVENHSREVLFSTWGVHWILRAPENISQQLEIAAEVTYFNGTSHVKVVLPILVRLMEDVGDTLEDARTIDAGIYRGYLSAFLRDYDVDCYGMWLLKGQTVRLRMAFRQVSDVNLTLYDPGRNPKASVSSARYYDDDTHFTEELARTIDADGYWHIKLSAGFDNGIYLLTVKVEQQP